MARGWTGAMEAGLRKLRRKETAGVPCGRRDRPLLGRVAAALEYLRARGRRRENGRG